MKILVMINDYPMNDGKIGAMFVHTRCKLYQARGIDINVICGITKENYIIDSIPVFTVDYYEKNLQHENYDILISHAPYLGFDIPFIEKFGQYFPKIIFVFHGQEVLFRRKVYSKPYSYMRRDFISRLKDDYYDILKLSKLNKFFKLQSNKAHFVFVSNWMYNEFKKWVRYDPKKLGKATVIYNCIGKEFETAEFDAEKEKSYDFISIRSSFDGSKYCVDLICELARRYPKYKFLLVGQGNYFKHYECPSNVHVIYKTLSHKEVLDLCNTAKCSLMLTRTDAQGVMACEIATFGMPLITSNIDVMREVFEGFANVFLVPNDAKKIDLPKIYSLAMEISIKTKNEKYFEKNTSDREIELFERIVK